MLRLLEVQRSRARGRLETAEHCEVQRASLRVLADPGAINPSGTPCNTPQNTRESQSWSGWQSSGGKNSLLYIYDEYIYPKGNKKGLGLQCYSSYCRGERMGCYERKRVCMRQMYDRKFQPVRCAGCFAAAAFIAWHRINRRRRRCSASDAPRITARGPRSMSAWWVSLRSVHPQ
jgi:hypothetical protein